MTIEASLHSFMQAERLPQRFSETAHQWYLPLLRHLVDFMKLHRESANTPLFVGINGAQGSGKSTLSAFMVAIAAKHYNLNAVSMSLDDFYLSKQERISLGNAVHPLLATRGVPGTHDIALLTQCFDTLSAGDSVRIPVFDKTIDDRAAPSQWQHVDSKLDLVVLEGWCVGCSAQPESELSTPLNTLERTQDPDGYWRRYVNSQLANQYQDLFARLNQLIMLKAPSFEHIYTWRLEQEEKMQAKNIAEHKAPGGMSKREIADFIQHYQRITEHGLRTLPQRCDRVFELDPQRKITACFPAL